MEPSNITLQYNETEPYHPVFVISIAALMFLLSIVTVLGNLMVMVSFYIDKAIRQPSNYFIFSLAVSDFIIGLEGFPLYTVYVLQREWTMGWFVCDLWLSVDYTVCLASIYTVLFITIDRYCSVRIPTAYRNWRTKNRVCIIIIIIWVMPALLFFVSIFGWNYFTGTRRSPALDTDCYVQFMDDGIFNMSMYISYYWSTLVVMIGLYAGIYKTAKELQKKSEQRHKRLSAVAAMQANVAPIGVCMSPRNKSEAVTRNALLARLSSAGEVIDEEDDVLGGDEKVEAEEVKSPDVIVGESANLGLAPALNNDSFNSTARLIPSKSTLTGTGSLTVSTNREGTTTELSKSSSVHSSDVIESDESRTHFQNNSREEHGVTWRKASATSAQQIGVLMKRARFRAAAAAVRLFHRKASGASVGSQPSPKPLLSEEESPGKRRFSDMLFGHSTRKQSEPTLLKFRSCDECAIESATYSETCNAAPATAAACSTSSMMSPTTGVSLRRQSLTQLEQIEERLVEEDSYYSEHFQDAAGTPPPDDQPHRPSSAIDDTISHNELFRVESGSATVKTAPVVSPENSVIGTSEGGPSLAESTAMKRSISNDKQRYLSTLATPSRRLSQPGLSAYNDDVRYASSIHLTRDRKFDRIRFIDSESIASATTTMSTLASKSIAGRTISLNLSSHSFSPFITRSIAQRSSASVQMISPFDAASNPAVTDQVSVDDEAVVVVHPRRRGVRSHSADSSLCTNGSGNEHMRSASVKRSAQIAEHEYEQENCVNVVLISDDIIEVETPSANKENTILTISVDHNLQAITDPSQPLGQPQRILPLLESDQQRRRSSIFESAPFKFVQRYILSRLAKTEGPSSTCRLTRPKGVSTVSHLESLRSSGRVSFNQNGRGRKTSANAAKLEDDDEDEEEFEYSSTGHYGDSDKRHRSPSGSITKSGSRSGLFRSQEHRSLLGRLTSSTAKPSSTQSLRIPTLSARQPRPSASVRTVASDVSTDSLTVPQASSGGDVEARRQGWSRESSRILTGLLRGDTTKRLRNGAAGVAQAFRQHGRRVRGAAMNRARKSKSENRAKKALRTITFILGAFIVFWTPFYVLATMYGFDQSSVPLWLYTTSYYMCYLNSPINPFCYAMVNVQFKKAFVRMLKGDFHRT